jgi:N-acetylmuramoyl-L-alanine amidase
VKRLCLLVIALAIATFAGSGSALAAPLIAIDPGHGGADSGAVGILPAGSVTGLPPRFDADGQTVLFEKDVTLDVSQRLNAFLQARGFPTVMTRTQDLAGGDVPYTTVTADLKARTDIANAAGARLFVSIHENALSATTEGTETFHFYYANPGARALAQLVHQEVVAALGLPDRGVKTAGFYVLKHTTMPAILVEGAFLSNPNEALLLADPNVRQRLAEAVGTGVVKYTDAGYDAIYGVDQHLTIPRYQVNAGAFRKLSDARSRYRMVRRKGFAAAIRSEFHANLHRNLFFVVAGKFVSRDNALILRNRMRTKHLHANVAPVATRSRPVPSALK